MSGGSGNGNSKGEAPTQTSTGASNPNVTPGIPLFESGSASSTTYGTLTDGKITIGGQHMTSAAGLGAHTDLATAHTAIAPLPDLKNVMSNQQAMAAAANTVIATSAQIGNDLGVAAGKKVDQAQGPLDSANKDVAQAQAALDNSTPEQRNDAQKALDVATQNRDNAQLAFNDAQAAAARWGPTGDYTRDLKVVTAILVGGVAGQGAGQIAANASAPFAAQAIGDYFAQPGHDNQTVQLLSHAVLGAILAVANGGSAAAGAGAGAAGELAAQEITRQLYPTAFDADGTFHPEKLNANQIQTVIGLSTAVGALVAGVTGGSALDASVGGSIAANAATYNRLLSHDEKAKLKQLQQGLSPEGQKRLADASCAMVHCSAGLADGDAKAAAEASERRGKDYVAEQSVLADTGLFTRSPLDTLGDIGSRAAGWVSGQPIGRLATLVGGQMVDLGYGVYNLGHQILTHGPSAIPQSPPDFPNDSNWPTGSAGAVVTPPMQMCGPEGLCVPIPSIVTVVGTSGSKRGNLIFSSGSDSGASGGSGDGSSGANSGAGTITSEGTANAVSGQGLKGQLASENLANIAAQDPRLAAAVKGSSAASPNFSIGTGTVAEANQLGQTWVGDGARLVGNQTACPGCLISADGTRIYRPPQPKTSSFATTGIQANFVQQTSTGTVISNGHLNVTR
jgi:hypothetical protein